MPRPNPISAAPSGSSLLTILEKVESFSRPISVAELADIYDVNRKTVYKAIQSGTIPTVDIGLERRVIDPKTLAYFLRQRNPVMSRAARG